MKNKLQIKELPHFLWKKLHSEKVSQNLRDFKAVVEEELRIKRQWQSYVLAVAMVGTLFLLANSFFGEDPEPVRVQPFTVEVEPGVLKPESPPIRGFTLVETPPGPSYWQEADQVATALSTHPIPSAPDLSSAAAPVDPPPLSPSLSPDVHATVPPPAEMAVIIPPPVTNAPEDPVAQAEQTTRDFYGSLNQGDLERAYRSLSTDFRHTLSLERFQAGYQQVSAISHHIKYTEKLSQDLVRVDLELRVSESGREGRYFVTCLLTREVDRWTLSGIAQIEG
jgi:hypothetical protein